MMDEGGREGLGIYSTLGTLSVFFFNLLLVVPMYV